MHNKLKYQAKIHTICAKRFKRKNKNLHLFPNFFLKFIYLWKTTKTCFNGKENKTKPSMCGKIKLVHKEK
jgi:hypothetical protein